MTWTSRPAPPRASRRAVLTAVPLAPAAWLATGCDAPGSRRADPSPAPRDPDATLLEQAGAAARAAELLAASVIARHPSLAQALTPLREMHETHLKVLVTPGTDAEADGTPSALPVPPAPRRPAAALRAVIASEQQYAATLATGAQGAGSGDLARVLASARAGVLMHLAALGPAS